MTRDQLNTVLTGLCTGRALASESMEVLVSDHFLEPEDKENLVQDLENDLDYINEAIILVELELKE